MSFDQPPLQPGDSPYSMSAAPREPRILFLTQLYPPFLAGLPSSSRTSAEFSTARDSRRVIRMGKEARSLAVDLDIDRCAAEHIRMYRELVAS